MHTLLQRFVEMYLKMIKLCSFNEDNPQFLSVSKAYQIFIVFLFCSIHTQTRYYIKEYVIRSQIFSAAVLPNIIKIGQCLTE